MVERLIECAMHVRTIFIELSKSSSLQVYSFKSHPASMMWKPHSTIATLMVMSPERNTIAMTLGFSSAVTYPSSRWNIS